jgi:CrcB protein
MKIFLIALGGGIGAVLRYSISGLDCKYSNGVFPFNTLFINISGSFIIGLLCGLFESFNVSPNTRLFIFVGILGGYTTFSTFALENFNLFRTGESLTALLNILLSNLLGIALVFAGYILSKLILNLLK